MTFELIQHCFTKPAKRTIEKRYPKTKLEMDESKRKYKWGRYGIGKYVYDAEQQQTMRDLFQRAILDKFDGATIEYFT